jgi:hypothetical protein
MEKMDKVDFYIVFDSKDLPRFAKARGKRDIWMVPYDIDLEKVPCKVHVRRQNVDPRAAAWLSVKVRQSVLSR